jgi:hypothetical protein
MRQATSRLPVRKAWAGVRAGWVALAVLVTALPGEGAAAEPAAAPAAEKPVDFAESIRPIFARRCIRCHGADRQKGGLRVDRKDAALQGGESGALLVPGNSKGSLLIRRLTAEEADRRMPAQADPLPPGEIDLIRRWIDQGAPWPQAEAKGPAVTASDHWSFRPIRAPEPPRVRRAAWVRDPIDRFVLARLEEHRVGPSPEADRPTLLRRLSLDLTGLPPTPAEVKDFVGDSRSDAYERLVDRLLASPHFGERWGGHWLDLARYADSDGYEQDDPRPYAYRWRDWVIGAVNADMPFDRFTVEQLAGDLLPKASESQVLATGFHRNAPTNGEGGVDGEEARVQAVVDRVNTTGTVWLGLTVGCAECHDHKFDPLPQAEYYQLFAFFNDGVDEVNAPATPTPVDRARHVEAVEAYQERLAGLRARLKEAAPEDRPMIERSLKALEKKGPPRFDVRVAVFGAAARPRQTHVHRGGDFRNLGQRVAAAGPAVLPRLVSRRGDRTPPDRLDLARWLVDPSNPLTARVEANRIWQHLFGAGIVATPDDFGTQGEPPSHPELLDHLATRLVRSGWSRKALIRAVVCSATYRQESARRADVDALDPGNRWVHRQNRFRLDAEVIRDQTLAAAGLLDRTAGGPGIRPPVPKSFKSFAYRFRWVEDPPPASYRRGVYIFFQRNMIFPMLRTFDRSDTNLTCVRRERSNTPLQALTLLNDPQFLDAYRALGLRLLRAPGRTAGQRLGDLFLTCLGREPSDEERRVLTELLDTLRKQYREAPAAAAALVCAAPGLDAPREEAAAWVGVVRVLMNTDQFTSRE